ncbi:hypothetical protein Poli38472_002899 [Pythium oligandrum]|uniref:Uncharacterized protein n=1 Tax=Pythium oligandrum TaxID=41045 RepID=A0A8K1C5S4_PYTOL|nr:hypothetical protein Poli38472_002899 [Pythium oligandrum]|eukprot:TMW56974.1 hypothetical protein Poli38472_002899 [Pythium oligandrum]
MEDEAKMLSMEERLQRMLTQPQRRNRGQVPMHEVEAAWQYQRTYVPQFTELDSNAITDCSETLQRLRDEKREARDRRDMTWEDHLATEVRDEITRAATTKAKRLAQETAMLSQIKTDMDKWNMAVDLNLCEYLTATLGVLAADIRCEYLLGRIGAGQTPLHRAVKGRKAAMLSLLLSMGADMTIKDDSGKTAMHLAVEAGAFELFLVLAASLTPDQRNLLTQFDNGGFSLLHAAATSGNVEMVRAVIDAMDPLKVPVLLNQQTQKEKLTPLHLAARLGHDQCLRFLLRTPGTRANLRTTNGSNALHLSLEQTFNIDTLVQIFLECTPSQGENEEDAFQAVDAVSGCNCLHLAILKNYRNVSLALIRSRRIELNTATRDGAWTPLHLAVMTEEIAIVRELLEHGAMVDMVDQDGQTPLLQACLGGQLDVVQLLLSSGANPAHQNKQAHSALHYLAAFCRDRPMLVDLIGRGADVNAKSLKLNTPLHFAAMNGNEVATEVLMTHGANVSAINEDKHTVVYLAKKWRHRAVEDLVKPPEEQAATPDSRPGTAASRSHHQTRNSHHPTRRETGMGSHSPSPGSSSIRSRTPLTTRSDDSDACSLYSFDDEEILAPSTPWPGRVLGEESNNGRNSIQPARSFAELCLRFDRREAVNGANSDKYPLKPLLHAQTKPQHRIAMQVAREIVDSTMRKQEFTRFTRRLLTSPVHIPWEMTVPLSGSLLHSSTSDSDLQRRLKPSIRTNIGLLRDHLTHAQELNWPRYANQRVFRKDPLLP